MFCAGTYRAHTMDGVFLCQGKTTYPMDGWVGREVMEQWTMRMKFRGKKRRLSLYLLVSSPPILQLHRCGKRNEISGSKSPEFVHHIASQVTCGWRSVQLKETELTEPHHATTSVTSRAKKLLQVNWVCVRVSARKSLMESVWDQISGKRRWCCFQSVCKNTCQTTAAIWTLFLYFFSSPLLRFWP